MRNICTWTLSLWKTSQCYWHDNVEFLTINFFFELSVFYKITDNLWGNFFVIFYCKHVTNCQCWLELLFLMECTVFDGVNSFLPNCSLSQGTLIFFYLAVLLLLDCKLCTWSILNWCIENNKKCFFFCLWRKSIQWETTWFIHIYNLFGRADMSVEMSVKIL